MKTRPVLFSSAMVRAILDGRKTQTRRVMRPQPPAGWFGESPDETREDGEPFGITPRWLVERCPHGKPGDRLWVKETIRRVNGRAVFAADGAATVIDTWPWKRDVLTAIHTPRGASRITLEVTEVRVQRLAEITEDDARAEGCTGIPDVVDVTPREEFQRLWDSINGKRAPWVWALTFRRLP